MWEYIRSKKNFWVIFSFRSEGSVFEARFCCIMLMSPGGVPTSANTVVGGASALHSELASRLVVFLDSARVPSPVAPFLATAIGGVRSEEVTTLVAQLVRSGMQAELSPALPDHAVCSALFHFLGLLNVASNYDVLLLAFSLPSPAERLYSVFLSFFYLSDFVVSVGRFSPMLLRRWIFCFQILWR
jgi:hypothetical protein